MQDELVLTQRVDKHILVVILNRPEKRNAINIAASQALADIVQRAEQDDSVRVVVLTGAGGKCFSAGADLEDIAAGRGHEIAIGDAGMGGLMFVHRNKPWIAAVRGNALGGGMELALACDMIVAGQGAAFGLPEVRHGLIAAAGGVYRAVRSLPKALAIEMLTTGLPISAQRAHAHGMVNHVVGDDDVVACALRLADSIAANPPAAVGESLRIARCAADQDEDTLRTMMMDAATRLLGSDDTQESLRAFRAKQAPRSSLH
ncbi:enoyl-CoA hydratase/isomerase family protein [Noviherbaspirillum saxi]|uniref:Enoyl-CoA hydratase n=1 Tax=Noviherbaspirillum saxi TaxID=2320863 RepID=A0A3A3FH43_9BURK|nr:enoyl-CoA hydratase-related protein [Noviherbaspirillum saxi]RJF91718.1 enoyl-CoA hydratase [Noviherbaspirillum saxi]